ncbi:thiamine pyrophosphate-dependent dehydrogenase E1 component subunit alpha [Salinibacterium soli]|uniref:Thiamine pyrophosphate-dependent dehydrogenase E1 component subunit alpha n=1 Tax=Antiquaquibacter soli TaxID=3064523 RepID=A0ABT9BTV9_9MICO|nr:thiamine pyrophosphate-dependent dehydrogenase E1 component subunit alpha [Protaetiibacter sp. WY-16]MDO7882792.1 thiamine pyrophosphate-dependent dehydrogenase E1 component subunit alpha [Protaetiibacter sp. WY-16]
MSDTLTDAQLWRDRYRLMVLMRRFEEACLTGVASKEIHGELHTAIGQEAIAAALAEHIRDGDSLASTHRNHLHAIAKRIPLHPLMAEIFEKETGLCGGFGGHMHLFDRERRFSTTGIVGASLPVALGHAYAAKISGRDSVAFAVIGDGSVNTGGFHETMNMASVLGLALVVIIENNEWAISVPFSAASSTPTLAERASAYSAPGERVDGLDVDATSAAIGRAVAHARSTGPAIVEAMCYRFRGHYEGDLDLYRSQTEKTDRTTTKDPVVLLRAQLRDSGMLDEATLGELEAEASAEIDAVLAAVRAESQPDRSLAHDHVFASGLTVDFGTKGAVA